MDSSPAPSLLGWLDLTCVSANFVDESEFWTVGMSHSACLVNRGAVGLTGNIDSERLGGLKRPQVPKQPDFTNITSADVRVWLMSLFAPWTTSQDGYFGMHTSRRTFRTTNCLAIQKHSFLHVRVGVAERTRPLHPAPTRPLCDQFLCPRPSLPGSRKASGATGRRRWRSAPWTLSRGGRRT